MNWAIQVKSIDGAEDGTFEGILSTYGNIDEVGDVCEKGCFDASLAMEGAKRPLLWQHDTTQPIGSFEAYTDETSLRIKGRINLEVARGREAYALLKAGDLDGASIGYLAEDYDYDRDGIRHLRQVRLLEGSLVTFPANPLARVQAKSLEARKARIMKYAQMKSLDELDEATRQKILKELAELDEAERADDSAEEKPAAEDEEKSEDKPAEETAEQSEDQTDEEADLKAEVEKLKSALADIQERLK